MEIKVVPGRIEARETDAAIVGIFEGTARPEGEVSRIDRALDGAIGRLIAGGEIKGRAGEITLIHSLGKMPAERVVVVGLGKPADFTLERSRQTIAEAVRYLRRKGVKRVAATALGAGRRIRVEDAGQAVVEGSIIGLYTFDRHKTRDKETGRIEELVVVERDARRLAGLERACARGKAVADAVCLARDLINEPANYVTPARLANEARRIAAESGLECTVLEREQIEELGMGALLGVAQGSEQPPKFIVLRYTGGSLGKPPLGLLGKGITFDSGGISIKPAEGMGDMKTDMAGAATVIAAMRCIAQLKPKINVTALAPATENLPSGAALKPADVLTSMSGKTIEIVTTDAEGRLILADALGYAHKLGLAPLVDVATLTGAIRTALGDVCVGAFTNNQEFLDQFMKAAAHAGEKVWQLPMFPEYKEQNRSEVADIKNSGGAPAGSITAAQFLAEFAGDTPWVHLDIAATRFTDKERGYNVKGATGVMVRTLIDLALELAEK